jgi:aldehyde dehydrogenase (NAD+)
MSRLEQVEKLRQAYGMGRTRSYEWRVSQLKALKNFLIEREKEIDEALWKDLRKGHFESVLSEQGVVIGEIDFTLKHLSSWMQSSSASTPLVDQPGHCLIYPQPLGVVLIIGAWNYPINLLLAPLVGALAAGNAAVLKPSELAQATSGVLARFMPDYMDQEAILVMEGGIPETSEILAIPFDSIFFTGSGKVGKIVMTKAAEHLTPVTLELGGKSPAIILADTNLKVAARRVAWGKFMNSGQTCIAPDYVLAEASIESQFIEELKLAVTEFYGADPKLSPDYCRIVNDQNFKRLLGLMGGGEVVCGGEVDEKEKYIAPTILKKVTGDMPVMQEEIFGPILPVLTIANLDAAVHFINKRPKPLALYLFSNDKSSHRKVIEETSSGGVLLNDVVMHMPVTSLPFGGVGASGMGSYHGKKSFDTFTHYKGVMAKATWLDIPIRYAPYTDKKLKWVKRLI